MSTVTSGITSPFPFLRLYRAYIGAARDASFDTERTAFAEAATHQAAVRKIAAAI
jgi:hypothetical protein